MYTKVVDVIANTGGGTQDITFTPNGTDPSWTPKIAIIQWNAACTSTSAWLEHMGYGFGFTDGTNQRCVCVASEDNQARGDTAHLQANADIILALSPSGTLTNFVGNAEFTSWLTNGMRINWLMTPTIAFHFTVLFLGGDDITNTTVGTLMSGTSTGNISVTSLSYRPQFGMFLCVADTTENTSSAGAFLSLGAADGTNQWVQSMYTPDNEATMITRQYYSHSKVVVTHDTAVTGYASFSTFLDNGFTLNVGDAFPSSYPIYYLTIRGGSFAVGNNTEPASTGNQTVTTNKNTKAVAIFGLDTGTADAVQNDQVWSGGFTDSAPASYGHVWHDTNGTANAIVVSALDGAGHVYNNITANATANSTTWDDSAIMSSLSSSGFTLYWDNIGQARPYRYLTFGDSTAQLYYGTIDDEPSVSVSENLARSAIQSKAIDEPSQSISEDLDRIQYRTMPITEPSQSISEELAKQRITFGNITTETPITTSEEIERERETDRDIDETAVSVGAGSVDTILNFLRNIDNESSVSISELVTRGIIFSGVISDEPLVSVSELLDSIAYYFRTISDTPTIDVSDSLDTILSYIKNITTEPPVSVSAIVTGSKVPILYNVHFYEFPESVFDAVQAVLNPIYTVIKSSSLLFDIGTGVEVAKLVTLKFNAESQPMKQLTLLSHIVHAVPKTNTLIYSIEAEAIKILTLLQDIKQDALKTNTLRFNLTQLAEKTNTLLHHIASQPVKTGTLIFDIEYISEVIKTLTLQFHVRLDMTKPLTILSNIQAHAIKLNTLLFELRQRAQEQLVLRFDEAGQPIKTLTTPFHIREEMAIPMTRTLLFDIRTLVTKVLTTLSDIRQETSPAKILTLIYHLRNDMTLTRTLLFDVRQELTKVNTLLQEIKGGVTKQNILKFSIIAEIIDISNLLFNIEEEFIGQVVKTSILRFHVSQEALKSITLLFDELTSVIDTASLLYDIKKSTTKPMTFLSDIRQEVTEQTTMIQNIMQDATKTNTLEFEIKQMALETLTLLQNITKSVAKQEVFLFSLQHQPVKSVSLLFTIYQVFQEVNTLLFNITTDITTTNTFRFDIRKQLTKVNSLLADIEGAFGIVMKAVSLLQNIRSEAEKDLTTRFNITSITSKTLTLLHNILQTSLKQGVFPYSIRQSKEFQRTFKFGIYELIEKQNTIIFNELAGILKQNIAIFNISKATIKPTALKYNIISETVKARNLLFDIKQVMATPKTLTLNQQIFQKAETDLTLKHDILEAVVKRVSLQQNIFEELTKQNDLLFRITQETPELSTSVKFDIISQTTKLLRTLYDIRVFFEDSRSIIFNIFPRGVTPKITMHEKLLDFIFSQYSITTPTNDKILWHEWYNGQADICIDSLQYNHFTIERKSTYFYKERNYTAAIHIFYRDYSDTNPENRNIPVELGNIIRELQRIININRYNLYNEFGKFVYEVRIRDARFVPDPSLSEGSTINVLHYRILVEMLYHKLIT